MDASILAKFPDDNHVLGPFLGNLPPEVLNEVIIRLGWFKMTFALAGKTCRGVVERVPTRDLAEKERQDLSDLIGDNASIQPLISAAVAGDIDALKWLTETFEVRGSAYKDDLRITVAAARFGHLQTLNFVHDVGCEWNSCTSAAAAQGGHLEVLKYLHESGCPWDEQTCNEAARGGHLEVLKYLQESGCNWNKETSTAAAQGGHLEVLKYLHDNRCPWDKWTCSAAAAQGHFEVLRYAYKNGCYWDALTDDMASYGKLELLKCAHELGVRWHEWTCPAAARGGHLEVLKYAHENGCPWDMETCTAAAQGGHLEVLKYAHENGCPWDKESLCYVAAASGSLEMLKYAHENGCDWDGQTCTVAARGGHLEVLKYAHENGCEWDWTTCLEAAQEGHLEVLKRSLINSINETRHHEIELHGWDESLMVHPREFRVRLDKLKWQGDNIDDEWDWGTFLDAAKQGDIEVKKWATEHGCPWNSSLCLRVAEGGHLEVLQFLKVLGLQVGVNVPVRRVGDTEKLSSEQLEKEQRDWISMLQHCYDSPMFAGALDEAW